MGGSFRCSKNGRRSARDSASIIRAAASCPRPCARSSTSCAATGNPVPSARSQPPRNRGRRAAHSESRSRIRAGVDAPRLCCASKVLPRSLALPSVGLNKPPSVKAWKCRASASGEAGWACDKDSAWAGIAPFRAPASRTAERMAASRYFPIERVVMIGPAALCSGGEPALPPRPAPPERAIYGAPSAVGSVLRRVPRRAVIDAAVGALMNLRLVGLDAAGEGRGDRGKRRAERDGEGAVPQDRGDGHCCAPSFSQRPPGLAASWERRCARPPLWISGLLANGLFGEMQQSPGWQGKTRDGYGTLRGRYAFRARSGGIVLSRHPRESGGPEPQFPWMPAFAGMTTKGLKAQPDQIRLYRWQRAPTTRRKPGPWSRRRNR